MNITALLYIDNDLTDDDLHFSGLYLPQELRKRLESNKKITSVKYSAPSTYKANADADVIVRNDTDDLPFWKSLFTNLDADHIIKIYCDSPFIDTEIIDEMLEAHLKYLAEFTYSENLPQGYSCEIISRELLDAIPETAEKTLPMGQVIRSNINKFDVELYYKEPDIRDKRLSFRSGEPRERKILEKIYGVYGKFPGYSKIKDLINTNPDVLYVSPTYLDIEITGRCDLDCIFCYRKTLKKTHQDMDTELFGKILSDMKAFGLPYSVCFGGSGEPLMHKEFYRIMDLTRNEPLISNIILETNGILADQAFKYYILTSNDKRIKIIFNINGMDDETYKSVHNGDYFGKVMENIVSLKKEIPYDDGIYLQIMKINETENFLDRFYDFWEKHKIPVILQKQNTFLGRIKDRTFSDLSPLDRTPCWHLQRDINIRADGGILFCKQDIDCARQRGYVGKESLQEIFFRAKDAFLKDYNGEYPGNPDCASCNEWYTFNF